MLLPSPSDKLLYGVQSENADSRLVGFSLKVSFASSPGGVGNVGRAASALDAATAGVDG